MKMRPLNPHMARTSPPPVMEARRWIAERSFPADKPLLNLSQAAPVDPPPDALIHAMAEALQSDPSAHLYGPVLGRGDLREELAAQWSASYGGKVAPAQVAITAGCNEAFAAAMASLAAPGDNVILPSPHYFNHKMWLDMSGIEVRDLPSGDDLVPDPERAARLIDERTRAIVLVTPNNPTGAEYEPEHLSAFRDLARRHGIALVIDETYRDFHSRCGAPHDLFQDPEWDETLIQLYSFSKAYRLTGHRVGAIVASQERLAAIEKFLDTVTICPPQIGQIGALWGLQNLSEWLAGERAEILARRAAMQAEMQKLSGWKLLGCGAYFAYIEHPFGMTSDRLAKDLVDMAHILLLPGTMFGSIRSEGGTGLAERSLRVAFANADCAGIAEFARRLGTLPA